MLIQNFKDNFSQCLNLFHPEKPGSSDLAALLRPMYGLNDFSVYEAWKSSGDPRCGETDNLLYAMKNALLLPDLVHLADALIAAGYEAVYSPDYDPDHVKKQLMLLYMILRGDIRLPQ